MHKDDPTKVTLIYFKRYVQSAMENIKDQIDHKEQRSEKQADVNSDNHALAASIKSLTELVPNVTSVNSSNNRQHSGRYGERYCNFCKSSKHNISDCDHPRFDIKVYKNNLDRVDGIGEVNLGGRE